MNDIRMNDSISRQAAINELKKCRFVVDGIEKIRGLPSAEPNKDSISRQAAINELRKCRFVVDGIEKIRGLDAAQT